MKILLLCEFDAAGVSQASLRAVNACRVLDAEVTALLAGQGCSSAAEQLALVEGVSRVMVADHSCYARGLAEVLAPLLQELSEGYAMLVGAATALGKDVMPRTAALLGVSQLSEVVAIESANTFVRPIYAGNALARVRCDEPLKVLTVRASAFERAPLATRSAPIEHLTQVVEVKTVEWLSDDIQTSDRPDLASAGVVVTGGRGLGSGENFALIEALADALGGAVGATRAAVDAGYVGNELQVGQTGKIIAPDLYIAVGVSGAIQHLAGIKDARTIVAINKDPDAPIFEVADYGLVADLFDALPTLTARLGGGA